MVAAVDVPNTLLANGEALAVDEIPNPLKIEEVLAAVVTATGAANGFTGAEFPKMLAGNALLVPSVEKLKVVIGDAIAVVATVVVITGIDVFTRLIGVVASGVEGFG